MSGPSAYWESPEAIRAAGKAASTLGGHFQELAGTVRGIDIPPGVESFPAGKLAVAARRLDQVGKAVGSQAPFLENSARWAAVFNQTSPLAIFGGGIPGPAPGLVTPFANTDAKDHRGPDWLAGVVSPLGDLWDMRKQWKGALTFAVSPAYWMYSNNETIRYGIANTGKLSREVWRDAYASDAADQGDRDYAWGQRTTSIALVAFSYVKLAKAGATAVKSGKTLDRARAAEAEKRAVRDGLRAPDPARWGPARSHAAQQQLEDVQRQHAERLEAANKALREAQRHKIAAGLQFGWDAHKVPAKAAGAGAATAGLIDNPLTFDNAKAAQERQQGQQTDDLRKEEQQHARR
ncbi:MAG: hypothetical protein PGN13_08860 [Patulibacter minatonensis]